MCFNPSPERRVPSPNRYMAFARFCFCKNNKRTIITSYFPAPAPVSRTPSTASDVEPRGSSVSLSSFGDAASGAIASESSFILTADPPLSRA